MWNLHFEDTLPNMTNLTNFLTNKLILFVHSLSGENELHFANNIDQVCVVSQFICVNFHYVLCSST